MKVFQYKIIPLILFFLFISGKSQVTSGFVEYDVVPTELTKTNNTDVIDFMRKTDEQIKNIKFVLEFNRNESLFESINRIEMDRDEYFYKMALAVSGGKSAWYSSMLTKEVVKGFEFMGEKFLVISNFEDIKWEMSNESKKIGKHLAFKASCTQPTIGSKGIGSKKITVWYTPEIPINFGPLGLNGLPGLILEVSFGRVKYNARNISINNLEGVEIKRLTGGKEILEKDFIKLALSKINQFKKDNGKQ